MKDSIGKIALLGLLIFFCSSFTAIAASNYHPKPSGIDWEFQSDPSYLPSDDCFIISTSPFDGQKISGTYPLIIKYRGGSGICEWRFDDSKWFSMLYYGQGKDGIQEAQGIFDTTPFEGGHSITFRIWGLNGYYYYFHVNIFIEHSGGTYFNTTG